MSRDSDIAVGGREMDAERKARHAEWHALNMDAIRASGLPFKPSTTGERPETLLFRALGKPKVDFYPSTGRWREAGQAKVHRGGASAFIVWYRKARA